jgi:hypothetical protein
VTPTAETTSPDNQFINLAIAFGVGSGSGFQVVNGPSVTVTSAVISGSSLTVTGTLSGTPGQAYEVKYYNAPVADDGTQRVLLGSQIVTVGESGTAALSFTTELASPPPFEAVTATVVAVSGDSPLSVDLGAPISG